MNAEILSIGTELLLGHVANTDAAFLARELAKLGINLFRVTTVGDNAERLAYVLTRALERCDLVITTGGLGPTLDDLTKKVIAQVMGRRLVKNEEAVRHINEFFGNRPLCETEYNQAYLPEKAQLMANSVGTALGCVVTGEDGKMVMMLPGPPRELEPMFLNEAMPILTQQLNGHISSYMIRTFNITEAETAEHLGDLLNSGNPTAATYIGAHSEVFVRVTARGMDETESAELAMPMVNDVCTKLGDYVYGIDVDSLESVVVSLLAERGETVATAESCTGGLVAKRITDVPGASIVFRTGVVTYANEAKTKLLGVPAELIEQDGAVSESVARAMAEGIREKADATYGIGITGVAGPGGGTPEKPVGLVWIALATPEGTFVQDIHPKGTYPGRPAVRHRSAGTAFDMLRRYLLKMPVTYSSN